MIPIEIKEQLSKLVDKKIKEVLSNLITQIEDLKIEVKNLNVELKILKEGDKL